MTRLNKAQPDVEPANGTADGLAAASPASSAAGKPPGEKNAPDDRQGRGKPEPGVVAEAMPVESGTVSNSGSDANLDSGGAKGVVAPWGSAAPDAGLLRRLLDGGPDGAVLVDREWNFRSANRRAREMLGVPDLEGKNLHELFPATLEEPFFSLHRGAMDGVEGWCDAYYPAPLNAWYRLWAVPDELGFLLYFSDETARKQAEMRELETAERLTQVLEATSDAVFTVDRDWRFTLLNKRAAELIDPEHRLLGKVMWHAFPELEKHEPLRQAYLGSMHEKLEGNFEIYYPEPLNGWFAVRTQPTAEGVVAFFRNITEQKKHDALVARQQELLAVVQQASRMATWELDMASGGIHFGPGSHDLFGHSLMTVNTLERLREILLPGQEGALERGIAEAVRTGEMVVIEFAVRAADGSTVWIESRGQAVLSPVAGGQPLLRGMSIDVTERKLQEHDLVASAQRYRVLTDLNPQAIWAASAAGEITYTNQALLAYMGLTQEELNGQKWLEAFAPEDQARVMATWMHSVETGVDYEVEGRLRHAATGEYRYWIHRAAPVRDASGAILQWLGVGSDIHDEKTHQGALRAEQMEAERRRVELEAVYSSTPVALALLDPVDFRFLNLNGLEAELLGISREDAIGKRVQEVANVPGLMDLLRTVANGATIKDMLVEGEILTTAGLRRAWNVNYSPVYGTDGKVRAIVAANIEVTNQKRAEAALIQSEKLAAVGRLASSISHEINNPLEAITNLLYLIAQDPLLHEDIKVYVHMAQSELQRVSQIATQTLRFHRQAVNPTLVTPRELVGAVIRLYTGRLANSSIRVEETYATDTQVLCFENDIRQVLNNLIANAIDAMRHGGRLVVRAHAVTSFSGQAPRPGVRITIADTGHGMSKAVVERVFEPFYTTKDLNGTGLGLWISAGIVERHQGRLVVRSSVDETHHGTVFSLFLPCEEEASS